ncbi:MAG: ATP-dependent Clp protease ATP-binding subunit ClpX [Deltaproteobacteria bacterium]
MPTDGRTKGAFSESPRAREAVVLTPRQIHERLELFVIGQERAKRAISIAAYNHEKRCAQRRFAKATLLKKSNVLLIGPTGSGKTHLARNLAEILAVPFTVVDATEYTEAGYYGKDVEVMVAELLFKANHSLEETQRGIIFIDEIDKIARKSQGGKTGAGGRDIGGEGVQQALLKLLEGREIFVPLNVTQHWNKHDFVQVDTNDILFICAGTFSDLHQGRSGRRLGFGDGADASSRRRISQRELMESGMLAELLGRLPVVVELDALTPKELYRILVEPADAITREYRELLAIDDIDLSFTEGALKEVVRCATEKRLGARGLRAILEEVLGDILFEAPERRGERISIDARYALRRLESFDAGALRED